MTQEDIEKHFKGKKVTLMGLGLLGRGIHDAEFFAAAGADLIITDLKTEAELELSIKRLAAFPTITYHLGGHRMEDFENRDLVIKAPNTPLDSPFIAHARELGIPVEMDAVLFTKLSPATIVGITGTRGKSTVTHLIFEILKAAGKNPHLGGNERGIATLPLLKETGEGSMVVLELDSWQLQGFEDSHISPHVSIWTNFMRDHMNYYKNDMARYFQDKAAIARFQKKDDFFITTQEIKETIESRFGTLKSSCITNAALPAEWNIALQGEHNLRHAASALAAARCLGIPDDITREALRTFSGLPGRLQLVAEKNGIAFYDDSNATTPEATMAAPETLAAQKRPIILIVGGSDKELNFAERAAVIEKEAKQTVFLTGAATDKLKTFLAQKSWPEPASTMDEAFEAAVASAHAGDIILLSPAATSFGIFKNEYDRGDQFRALVEKLK